MRKLLKLFLDFLLPPRCGGCGESIDQTHALCSVCWSRLSFITKPFCETCGFPFELEGGDGVACGPCLRSPPLFTQLRSAFCYEDRSRDLILRFKHGDATYLTPLLVRWMEVAGRDLLEKADLLLPVPLHWRRLIKRGYNQAAFLAQGLAKRTNRVCFPSVLRRVRSTESQGHLTLLERRKNVSRAFYVRERDEKILLGKSVLLIDDVFTTGATVTECTKALKKAGARDVAVLTLARVVKPS